MAGNFRASHWAYWEAVRRATAQPIGKTLCAVFSEQSEELAMTPADTTRVTNFDIVAEGLLLSKDLHVTHIICDIFRDSPKQKKHVPRLEAHINALTEELGIHPERLAKEMSRAYPYGDVPDDIALQIATEACKQGPLTLRKGHYLYGNIVKIASELKRDYWMVKRGLKQMEDGNGKCFHEGDAVLYSELDNGRKIKAVH